MRLTLLLLLSSCTLTVNPVPPDAGVDTADCSVEIPNSCSGCLSNPLHVSAPNVCGVPLCEAPYLVAFNCPEYDCTDNIVGKPISCDECNFCGGHPLPDEPGVCEIFNQYSNGYDYVITCQ